MEERPEKSSIVEEAASPRDVVALGLDGGEIDTIECDPMLDTIDSCVACMDGIDLDEHHNHEGISNAEAAQVRLQVMDDEVKESSDATAFLPDLDLNICGQDELEDCKTTIHHATTTPTKVVKKEPSSLHCAICLQDVETFQKTTVTFCHLPCCNSSSKICTACMLLLSYPTNDGSCRIGRCPCCRSWLRVQESALSIELVEKSSQQSCLSCNQVKDYLVVEGVCDSCFLGRRRPLYYQCEQCNGIQQIPHPLYRYQPSVKEFGNVSWACQGQCKVFTMWRILPDQVRYIPAGDMPEEWKEDTIETAQQRVMEAKRNLAELNRVNDNSGGACIVQ